jgi:hypothetical protein
MRTVRFEVEIDLSTDKDLTPDQILEVANNIDLGIRRHEQNFDIVPDDLAGDVKAQLIRVKPKI